MNFAKLFNFPKHNNQLLVTKEFEKGSFNIAMRIGHPDVKLQMTLGYDSEEDRDREFEEFDGAKANEAFESLQKQLKDIMG